MDKDLEAQMSSAIAQLDKLSTKSSESGLSEGTCWEIFGGPCPEALKKRNLQEAPDYYYVNVEKGPKVINNTKANNRNRDSVSKHQYLKETVSIIETKELAKPESPNKHHSKALKNDNNNIKVSNNRHPDSISKNKHLKEETSVIETKELAKPESPNKYHSKAPKNDNNNIKVSNNKHPDSISKNERSKEETLVNENKDSPNNQYAASMHSESTPKALKKSYDNNTEKIKKTQDQHEDAPKYHKVNASKAYNKLSNADSNLYLKPQKFDHKMETSVTKETSSGKKSELVNNNSEERLSMARFSTIGIQQDFSSYKEGQTKSSHESKNKSEELTTTTKNDKKRDVGTMTASVDKKLGANKSIQTSDSLLIRSSTSSSTKSSFSTLDETDLSATDSLDEINKSCCRCYETNSLFLARSFKKPCLRCHSENLVKINIHENEELKRNLEMGDSRKKFKISNFEENNNLDDTKCHKKLQTSPINLHEGFRNPYNDEFNFYRNENIRAAKDSSYTFVKSRKKKMVNNACQYEKPKYQQSSESNTDDNSGKFWKKIPRSTTNNQTLTETLKTTLEKRNRVKQVVDKFEEQKADFISLRLPCTSYLPSQKATKICRCCCRGKT